MTEKTSTVSQSHAASIEMSVISQGHSSQGYDQPILKDLYNHVVPGVADKWRVLGVQLLDPTSGSTLDIIERNNPRDVVRCCQCMLEKWLEMTPDASWNQILAALRSPSVQLHHLASQIEQEFIPKSYTPVAVQRNILEGLNINNCRIDIAFTRISCKLLYLLKGIISVDEICFACFTNANTELGIGYPEDLKQKLNGAKSVTEFFNILSNYPTHWSWINIQVMEKIASLNDQAIKLVEHYKTVMYGKKLVDILSEVKLPDFKVDEVFYSGVKEKWNKPLSDITFKDIQDHKLCVGELFGVNRSAIVLIHIAKGCVENHWLIPRTLLHNAFDECQKNISKLANFDIISIEFIGTTLLHLTASQDYMMKLFAGNVKEHYRHLKLSKEKDSWLPIKMKLHPTIALVYNNRRKSEIKQMYLHFTSKKSINNIEKLFMDSGCNSILIEGDHGVGKTTLVKEICIKWAEEQILTSNKLVLLMLLRDPDVQKITNLKQLIKYFMKLTTEEILDHLCSHIEASLGIGIMVIIDGLDELGYKLQFFAELISGKVLPKATIVFTSQPYEELHPYKELDAVIPSLAKSLKMSRTRRLKISSTRGLEMSSTSGLEMSSTDGFADSSSIIEEDSISAISSGTIVNQSLQMSSIKDCADSSSIIEEDSSSAVSSLPNVEHSFKMSSTNDCADSSSIDKENSSSAVSTVKYRSVIEQYKPVAASPILQRSVDTGPLLPSTSVSQDLIPKVTIVSRSRLPYCGNTYITVKIFGFNQSSIDECITATLAHSTSKLKSLQKHLQQHPHINAMCRNPAVMSMMVFICLCQPNNLPSTATKVYANFINSRIVHCLQRLGKLPENTSFSTLEDLPDLIVHKALQQLEKIAFDGLILDKVLFKIDELPDACKDDPICFGLLQSESTEYSRGDDTTPTQFSFLHLGIQEYFAAKHVASLPDDEVHALLNESFIVCNSKSHDIGTDDNNKRIRFLNMWILFSGIVGGKCNHKLRAVVETYLKQYSPPPSRSALVMPMLRDMFSIEKFQPLHRLYLLQCFKEAQDDKLCDEVFSSFCGKIVIINEVLNSHEIASLGFFLSQLQNKEWDLLQLSMCSIGDYGIHILHMYLCGNKTRQYNVKNITLHQNNLSGTSSPLIGDVIIHLKPHQLVVTWNKDINFKEMSNAVLATIALKVLHIPHNDISVQDAIAIADVVTSLEELDISYNKLGDDGAVLLSKGITITKTLKVLDISSNNMSPLGRVAILDATIKNASLENLKMGYNYRQSHAPLVVATTSINNILKSLDIQGCGICVIEANMIAHGITSLEELNISRNTSLGPDGVIAISNSKMLKILAMYMCDIGPSGASAIIAHYLLNNTSLEELDICNNAIGPDGAAAIATAISDNKTLKILQISNNNIGPSGASAIAHSLLNNTSLEELNICKNAIGPDGANAIAKSLTKNSSLNRLDMKYNCIGENGALEILRSLHLNNSVTSLHLFGYSELKCTTSMKEEEDKINSARKKLSKHSLIVW